MAGKTFEQLKTEFENLRQEIAKYTFRTTLIAILGFLFIVTIAILAYNLALVILLLILFALISGFLTLKIIVQTFDYYKILNQVDQLAKKKFNLENLQYYPFIELKVSGSQKAILMAVKQVFEKLQLSKVKLDENKLTVTGQNNLMPRGFFLPLDLYALFRFISYLDYQRVVAKITSQAKNKIVLRLSVTSPFRGFDYFLLKNIETSLKASRKFKVISTTKPAEDKAAWYKRIGLGVILAIVVILSFGVPLAIGYLDDVNRANSVMTPVIATPQIAAVGLHQGTVYKLFTTNYSGFYYVVHNNKIYRYCWTDDIRYNECFYFDIAKMTKNRISREQYRAELNLLGSTQSWELEEDFGTYTTDSSRKIAISDNISTVKSHTFDWKGIDVYVNDNFLTSIKRAKNPISNIVIKNNTIYWKEENRDAGIEEFYMYIVSG